jgi:translation initiation factor 3 subunit C
LKKPGQESSSESDDEEDQSWLDDSDGDDDDDKKKKKPAKKETRRGKKEKKDKEGDDSESEDEDEKKKREEKEAKEREEEKWDAEKVDKKYKELVSRRGTKNYDRLKQVQSFHFLIEKCGTIVGASTPERILRLLFALVDAQFDANPNMATHMQIPMWKSCYNTFIRILEILKKEKQVSLVDYEPEEEPVPAPDAVYDPTKPVFVRGPLLPQLERLNDEFVKSLQFMDPHTQDYITRLRDELAFLKLARAIQDYFVETKHNDKATYVAARRLDHLYYKRERDAEDIAKAEEIARARAAAEDKKEPSAEAVSAVAAEKAKEKEEKKEPEEPLNIPDVADDTPLQVVVDAICNVIYKNGDDKLKRRAMLQHIYSLALHDRFFDARDLMLLSHLQDSIQLADAATQVLYNRALVQLGLAAFRRGRIVDAHNFLQEIVSLGRTKELLAQGMSSRFNQEKTPDQEKLERRRQVPYPMHVNLDVLEAASLISAMLLEIPSMAQNHHDPRRRVISKNLRKIMDGLDRQVFAGPPETTREHVVAACKALSRGDWQQCYDLLASLEMWKLVPKSEAVLSMLKRKIQEEGLRTYLFAFGQYYDSIKLAELANMFSLPDNAVHSIVSRMILSEELKASFDQPNNSLVMHRAEPTRLQYLSLQFADKAAVLVDSGDNADGQQGRPGRERWQEQEGGRRPYSNQNRFTQNQRGGGGQPYNGSRNRRTEAYANRAATNVRTRFYQNQRY